MLVARKKEYKARGIKEEEESVVVVFLLFDCWILL